uniref:Uncharacterized protein n=2 Tax=Picea TaxID=3328 RepID=A0A117NHP2_PICGL|nr:hypothetical protein ABT39_MTgene4682 [Picea glauca]QHR92690.1 hypothetical protein Q903MT_gene6738 [Picea sitchensis]
MAMHLILMLELAMNTCLSSLCYWYCRMKLHHLTSLLHILTYVGPYLPI